MLIMKKWMGALTFLIGIFAINASAWAFMPVIGLWNIEAEMNGQPGRGMMIEVRNESLFLTYFGYRSDGSSVKYNASGPLVNHTFTGDLIEYQGGTVIGGAYKPASLGGTIGTVTLSFTSGTHGTLTLPGESPKAIIKNPLWATENQDGLLGEWLFTMIIINPYTDHYTLTTKGPATSKGNGTVFTSTGSFGCEFQVSGTLAGMVACSELQTTYPDTYVFKFSGDRGDGIDYYGTNMTPYPAYVLRIATKTGAKTGLNDGTESAISILSTSPESDNKSAKSLAASYQIATPLSVEDTERARALASWASEVRAMVSPTQ